MGFIKSYKIAQIPASLSFANRTCLITGATSGLGFETAVHYVKLGAVKVYITARTVTKGRAAREAIEARTGRTGVVEILTLDMDDFAGVTTFMDILKRDIKALDIILLNAGLMTWDHEISPDGWEKTIQVDALSTVLLALLLLPWLKTVKQDGVVQHLGIVGSGGHTSIDISSPEFPKKDILTFYSKKNNFQGGKPQYDVSKLFLHYAAPEIAKLAVDSDGRPSPIVNTVCPGPVVSNLARDFTKKSVVYKAVASIFMRLFATNTEDGSKAFVLAGTTTPEEHGKFIRPYLTDAQFEEQGRKIYASKEGKTVQAEVWREIIAILKAAVPETRNITHV